MTNRKSKIKILSKNVTNSSVWGEPVKIVEIVWCMLTGESERNVKTDALRKSVYIRGKSSQKRSVYSVGLSSYNFKKPVALSKKTPIESLKKIECNYLSHFLTPRRCDATSEAVRKFILNSPSLSKNIDAEVLSFDKLRGEGLIRAQGQLFDLYACNIAGKKTWYPETACVYFDKGQKIKVDLHDGYNGLSPVALTQGQVDSDKWDKLDHSRLAFVCDESGRAKNGLFGGK